MCRFNAIRIRFATWRWTIDPPAALNAQRAGKHLHFSIELFQLLCVVLCDRHPRLTEQLPAYADRAGHGRKLLEDILNQNVPVVTLSLLHAVLQQCLAVTGPLTAGVTLLVRRLRSVHSVSTNNLPAHRNADRLFGSLIAWHTRPLNGES